MKIIYIIKSFTAIAGTERVISNKINYLSEKGNDVCLITYEQGNHPLAFHLNKTVKFCDINVRFFTLGKYNIIRKIYLFKKKEHIFSIKLEAIIKDFMPDIIIFTTYSFKLFGSILSISTKYNIKTIIESHVSMNSIIRHYDFKKGTFMYYMTLLLDLQSLKYIRKADAIVSLTAGDAKSWKKYKKAIVIPNPINIYPNIRKNEYETNRRIISVGRLNEQKGYDLLIKAFSKVHIKHKDWIIDIYGDGEDKCLLNDLIKQNKLEEVVKINIPTVKIYEEYIKSDDITKTRLSLLKTDICLRIVRDIPFEYKLPKFGLEFFITDKYNRFFIYNDKKYDDYDLVHTLDIQTLLDLRIELLNLLKENEPEFKIIN